MHRLRHALRDLARRSALPFGIAALLIAGLLGMHAVSVGHAMPAASESMSMPTSADAVMPAVAVPMDAPDAAHGCHDCATSAGADAMTMCGMVLLAAIGLGAASVPGILRVAPPVLLQRLRLTVRALGEPRPSLVALSISRT